MQRTRPGARLTFTRTPGRESTGDVEVLFLSEICVARRKQIVAGAGIAAPDKLWTS
jgi:hypothetical protein